MVFPSDMFPVMTVTRMMFYGVMASGFIMMPVVSMALIIAIVGIVVGVTETVSVAASVVAVPAMVVSMAAGEQHQHRGTAQYKHSPHIGPPAFSRVAKSWDSAGCVRFRHQLCS